VAKLGEMVGKDERSGWLSWGEMVGQVLGDVWISWGNGRLICGRWAARLGEIGN
jgi:hypothetical protein